MSAFHLKARCQKVIYDDDYFDKVIQARRHTYLWTLDAPIILLHFVNLWHHALQCSGLSFIRYMATERACFNSLHLVSPLLQYTELQATCTIPWLNCIPGIEQFARYRALHQIWRNLRDRVSKNLESLQ